MVVIFNTRNLRTSRIFLYNRIYPKILGVTFRLSRISMG